MSRSKRLSAIDVVCPRCKSQPGWSCRTTGGWTTAHHVGRWLAAGITEPSFRQRLRDSERHQTYRVEQYAAFLVRLRELTKK